MHGRLLARSSSLRAEVGDSRRITVHHSRSRAKLWELDASVIAGDLGQRLDDTALGDASVEGFSNGASSYALA